jgi:hypothetical protein
LKYSRHPYETVYYIIFKEHSRKGDFEMSIMELPKHVNNHSNNNNNNNNNNNSYYYYIIIINSHWFSQFSKSTGH